MSKFEWRCTTALGVASLLLLIALVTLTRANAQIQRQVAAQQMVINQGKLGQQIGQAVLRDMATASLENEAIRNILQKNGYNISQPESADE